VNCGGSGKIQIYGIDRDWVEEDCEWCNRDDLFESYKGEYDLNDGLTVETDDNS